MKVTKERKKYKAVHRNLRRARHLYSLFIKKACEKDRFGKVIKDCAIKAQERGLYATPCLKDIRWSFCRRFWRLSPEYQGWHSWSQYLYDFNFDNRFRKQTLKKGKVA